MTRIQLLPLGHWVLVTSLILLQVGLVLMNLSSLNIMFVSFFIEIRVWTYSVLFGSKKKKRSFWCAGYMSKSSRLNCFYPVCVPGSFYTRASALPHCNVGLLIDSFFPTDFIWILVWHFDDLLYEEPRVLTLQTIVVIPMYVALTRTHVHTYIRTFQLYKSKGRINYGFITCRNHPKFYYN